MSKTAKTFAGVLVAAGLIVFSAWAGWSYLRWTTATHTFTLVRDHLRDSLGLSEAVAALVGASTAAIAAFVVTILVVKARYLLAAVLLCSVVAVPLALLSDKLSADQCFNRQTDKPLCALWGDPEGHHHISRIDGTQPPSSWTRVRDATHDDVKAYMPNRGGPPVVDPADRVPRRTSLESCTTSTPVFFDARGEAVVFWTRRGDEIELWDRPGFQPTTGVPLWPMTSAVAAEVCDKIEAKVRRDAELQRKQEAALEKKQAAAAAQQAQEQAAQQEQERQAEVERERVAVQQAQEQAAQQEQERQAEVERERAAVQQSAAQQAQEQAARQAAQLAEEREREREEAERANSHRPLGPSGTVSRASLVVRNNDCAAANIYLDDQMVATVAALSSLPMAIEPGNHALRACQVGPAGCSQNLMMTTYNGAFTFTVNALPNCRLPTGGYLIPAPSVTRMAGPRTLWLPIPMGRRR